MKNMQDELIWQGRIHIGDEPGVCGDASYSGLVAELPITLRAFAPDTRSQDITFVLEAEDVNVFEGYSGHAVTVFGYEGDPSAGRFKWKQIVLANANLNPKSVSLALADAGKHKYLSIQLRVDTTVAAGLYNDFVWAKLLLRSTTHYAVLGFEG